MAVRLIERLSSSIPDWLRQALANKYQGFGDGWKTKDKPKNYPLDKIVFKNKGVPKTLKDIERDFLNGDAPVIKTKNPRGNGEQETVWIIEPDNYTNSTNDSYIFKKAWEDSCPYYDTSWKEIKPFVTEYGVIVKGEKQRDKLKDLRRDRADIKRKYFKDPEDVAKQYQRTLKKDASIYRFFKEIDAIYDELTEIFNQGMEKLSSLSDSDANDLYSSMQFAKKRYEGLVKNLEDGLADTSNYGNDWGLDRSYSKGNYFKRSLEDLKDDMEELKKKINGGNE